jgi:hypothetical protein
MACEAVQYPSQCTGKENRKEHALNVRAQCYVLKGDKIETRSPLTEAVYKAQDGSITNDVNQAENRKPIGKQEVFFPSTPVAVEHVNDKCGLQTQDHAHSIRAVPEGTPPFFRSL